MQPQCDLMLHIALSNLQQQGIIKLTLVRSWKRAGYHLEKYQNKQQLLTKTECSRHVSDLC